MRFKKYLEENAAQLAIPGMATKVPYSWGSNNPDVIPGKKCPPDKVWNEAKQKCEDALGTQEIRFQGARPTSSRITNMERR